MLGWNQWVFQLAVPPRRTMSCKINKGHLAKPGGGFQLTTLLKLLHIKMIANKLLQCVMNVSRFLSFPSFSYLNSF